MTYNEIAKFLNFLKNCVDQTQQIKDLDKYDTYAVLKEINKNFTEFAGKPEVQETLTQDYDLYLLEIKTAVEKISKPLHPGALPRFELKLRINLIKHQLSNPTYLQHFLAEPDEQQATFEKNPYEQIFSNDLGYTIFLKMHNLYKEKEIKNNSNYSFLYYALDKDNFLTCIGTEFINFSITEFDVKDFTRIDNRYKEDYNKSKLYNAIKDGIQK